MTTAWITFNLVVLVLLGIDLYIHRQSKAHTISFKEALITCAFWVSLALLFNVWVYYSMGSQAALEFFTAYLIEESLSMDNLFVFALIFKSFRVPDEQRHKVLFWGILGAIIMRALFILGGFALVQKFHWLFYIFGAILIYSGIKLLREEQRELHAEDNPVIKLYQRFFPVTHVYHNGHFFIQEAGKWLATPLFLVLLAVETVDLIFALDSIPAVLGITSDPFIAYTSNILAILGLRSLYFVLSHAMSLFHYLHYALSGILIFIGLKMVLADFFHVPIFLSLGIVIGGLLVAIACSLLFPAKIENP